MISFNYSGNVNIARADNASLIMNKEFWYLLNNLKVDIIINEDKYEIFIPKGYLTDGASVPRIFWNICPQWDRSHRAVVLHDYLCEYGVVRVNGVEKIIHRELTDKLFLEALRFEGLSKVKCAMMYTAVRLHSNVYHLDKPAYNKLKLQCEDEIRINLDKGYYN